MNRLLLLAATYVVTGIALTGYDFAAPPLHAKVYVIRRDHLAAIRNWFTWPLGTAVEVYQLAALGRGQVRHLLGVVALALGVLLVLRFVFLIAGLFIPWTLATYALAMVVAVAASPVVCAMVMPKHGQKRATRTASGGESASRASTPGYKAPQTVTDAIREQSAVLHAHLPAWVDLPDAPALKAINALMLDLWRRDCHAYLFALIYVAEAKKDRLFPGSEREKAITRDVAQLMLESTLQSARQHSLIELTREKALEAVAHDLAGAKRAARAFIAALTANQTPPDQALIDYFAAKIGVPNPRRPFFEAHLRSFTKAALLAFSSGTT